MFKVRLYSEEAGADFFDYDCFGLAIEGVKQLAAKAMEQHAKDGIDREVSILIGHFKPKEEEKHLICPNCKSSGADIMSFLDADLTLALHCHNCGAAFHGSPKHHEHHDIVVPAPDLYTVMLAALKKAREAIVSMPESYGMSYTHLPEIDIVIQQAEGHGDHSHSH